MLLLGLVLPVIFVPGFAGAAVSPRWALLSGALPIMFSLPDKWKTGHTLLAVFTFWAVLTIFWTVNPYEGVDHVWKFVVLTLAAFIASQQATLRPLFIGLSIGMGVNSALIIAQFHFGLAAVAQMYPNAPSGLFFNRNLAGEAAALVLVGALAHRLYWGAVLCVPAVVYPACRGAILGLALVALAWLWTHSRGWAITIATFGLAAGAYVLFSGVFSQTLLQRALIWLDIAESITLLGHGIGSFYTAFQLFMDRSLVIGVFVEHAHNDYLQVFFELGIIGLVLFVTILVLSCLSEAKEKYVVLVFAVEACFGFPFYMPVTAFIAFCCMGYCLCYRDYLCNVTDYGRTLLCSRSVERQGYPARRCAF